MIAKVEEGLTKRRSSKYWWYLDYFRHKLNRSRDHSSRDTCFWLVAPRDEYRVPIGLKPTWICITYADLVSSCSTQCAFTLCCTYLEVCLHRGAVQLVWEPITSPLWHIAMVAHGKIWQLLENTRHSVANFLVLGRIISRIERGDIFSMGPQLEF